MCIICIEFQKQLITVNEARGILSEMQSGMDPAHLVEIEKMFKDEREYDDS
jgi:hypothetical protein